MTDREMLELAAKAAGIEFTIWHDKPAQVINYGNHLRETRFWNPLTDDGDALQLAVKLNITVHPGFAYTPTGKLINYRDHANRIAATRRAIVRAASEIGRNT